MARPTKWNEKLQAEIVALVESGTRPEVAAGVKGITRSTFFEWMSRGKDGEEPYAGFRTSITRAVDVFEAESTRKILAGDVKGEGFGPAKAALEVLSRRMPRQWAQQVKYHVETVEDEFLTALEHVCADPNVHARVCAETDCRQLFVAFCEALAGLESQEEARSDSSSRAESVH